MKKKRFCASYCVHQNGDINVFFKSGDDEFGGRAPVRAVGNFFDSLYSYAEREAVRHGGELDSLCVDQTESRAKAVV